MTNRDLMPSIVPRLGIYRVTTSRPEEAYALCNNQRRCKLNDCQSFKADQKGHIMSINKSSDVEANLQIGPTDRGMVRLYIEAGDIEIPMDFEPEEAEEIAEEIKAAARMARTKA